MVQVGIKINKTALIVEYLVEHGVKYEHRLSTLLTIAPTILLVVFIYVV